MTIKPPGCPRWSAEHESNLTKIYDSYTTRRDAIKRASGLDWAPRVTAVEALLVSRDRQRVNTLRDRPSSRQKPCAGLPLSVPVAQ